MRKSSTTTRNAFFFTDSQRSPACFRPVCGGERTSAEPSALPHRRPQERRAGGSPPPRRPSPRRAGALAPPPARAAPPPVPGPAPGPPCSKTRPPRSGPPGRAAPLAARTAPRPAPEPRSPWSPRAGALLASPTAARPGAARGPGPRGRRAGAHFRRLREDGQQPTPGSQPAGTLAPRPPHSRPAHRPHCAGAAGPAQGFWEPRRLREAPARRSARAVGGARLRRACARDHQGSGDWAGPSGATSARPRASPTS